MKKIFAISIIALPVVLMVALIPFVTNDYLLTATDAGIILAVLARRHARSDLFALAFGFIAMTISEMFFIHTGVETFNRTTLFGIMPLWLPILWAYGFVAIKRSVAVLER